MIDLQCNSKRAFFFVSGRFGGKLRNRTDSSDESAPLDLRPPFPTVVYVMAPLLTGSWSKHLEGLYGTMKGEKS